MGEFGMLYICPHEKESMEKYQTVFRRIIALIIDGIFTIVPFSLISQYINIDNDVANTVFLVSKTFIPFIYFIVMNYLFGQTLGKMVASIKIVDISETRGISFKQAFLREIIWIVLAFIEFVFIKTFSNTSWVDAISLYDTIVFIIVFIIIIFMFNNDKRRAIHDIIADTVVVICE
jgi:uncharacterized RDD family membrane protein YckC